MKSFNEKEKKLNDALSKLNALSIQKTNLTSSIEELSNQKNQLEIEKQELEEKYKVLVNNLEVDKEEIHYPVCKQDIHFIPVISGAGRGFGLITESKVASTRQPLKTTW